MSKGDNSEDKFSVQFNMCERLFKDLEGKWSMSSDDKTILFSILKRIIVIDKKVKWSMNYTDETLLFNLLDRMINLEEEDLQTSMQAKNLKSNALINKGNALINKGNALINKGNALINKGNALISDDQIERYYKISYLFTRSSSGIKFQDIISDIKSDIREAAEYFRKAEEYATTPLNSLNCYTKLAACQLELGDLDAVIKSLQFAESYAAGQRERLEYKDIYLILYIAYYEKLNELSNTDASNHDKQQYLQKLANYSPYVLESNPTHKLLQDKASFYKGMIFFGQNEFLKVLENFSKISPGFWHPKLHTTINESFKATVKQGTLSLEYLSEYTTQILENYNNHLKMLADFVFEGKSSTGELYNSLFSVFCYIAYAVHDDKRRELFFKNSLEKADEILSLAKDSRFSFSNIDLSVFYLLKSHATVQEGINAHLTDDLQSLNCAKKAEEHYLMAEGKEDFTERKYLSIQNESPSSETLKVLIDKALCRIYNRSAVNKCKILSRLKNFPENDRKIEDSIKKIQEEAEEGKKYYTKLKEARQSENVPQNKYSEYTYMTVHKTIGDICLERAKKILESGNFKQACSYFQEALSNYKVAHTHAVEAVEIAKYLEVRRHLEKYYQNCEDIESCIMEVYERHLNNFFRFVGDKLKTDNPLPDEVLLFYIQYLDACRDIANYKLHHLDTSIKELSGLFANLICGIYNKLNLNLGLEESIRNIDSVLAQLENHPADHEVMGKLHILKGDYYYRWADKKKEEGKNQKAMSGYADALRYYNNKHVTLGQLSEEVIEKSIKISDSIQECIGTNNFMSSNDRPQLTDKDIVEKNKPLSFNDQQKSNIAGDFQNLVGSASGGQASTISPVNTCKADVRSPKSLKSEEGSNEEKVDSRVSGKASYASVLKKPEAPIIDKTGKKVEAAATSKPTAAIYKDTKPIKQSSEGQQVSVIPKNNTIEQESSAIPNPFLEEVMHGYNKAKDEISEDIKSNIDHFKGLITSVLPGGTSLQLTMKNVTECYKAWNFLAALSAEKKLNETVINEILPVLFQKEQDLKKHMKGGYFSLAKKYLPEVVNYIYLVQGLISYQIITIEWEKGGEINLKEAFDRGKKTNEDIFRYVCVNEYGGLGILEQLGMKYVRAETHSTLSDIAYMLGEYYIDNKQKKHWFHKASNSANIIRQNYEIANEFLEQPAKQEAFENEILKQLLQAYTNDGLVEADEKVKDILIKRYNACKQYENSLKYSTDANAFQETVDESEEKVSNESAFKPLSIM